MNGIDTDVSQQSDGHAIAALQVEVSHLIDAVSRLDKKVDTLTAQANRWRGAFLVILSVGGLIGSAATALFGWATK